MTAVDRDQIPNRCSYRYGPERCAYLARVFANCTEQSKDATLENGLCWGHHNNHDAESCRRLLDQGLREIPIDFDYRSANLVELSKKIPSRFEGMRFGYGSTEVPKMSDAEWADNVRQCQPIIDQIKATLARAAAAHRDDAMPHAMAPVGGGFPYRGREPGEEG